MKPVTRYEANDGVLFSSAVEACQRDMLLEQIAVAMAPLGAPLGRDKSILGWIHHRQINIKEAKRAILKLCRPLFESGFPEIIKAIDNDPDSVHPRSIVGRVLDDSNTPLRDAWYRFMCIDDQGREHNQPYYSVHEPMTYHICVEDRR